MSKYQIQLEVVGATAMWTRPDTGDHPVSYPAPTYSAVKGLLESILWWQTVEIIPHTVEICSPIQYHDYWNNYRGPLRKTDLQNKGNSQQIKMTVLTDVCYRIYANLAPVNNLSKLNSVARQSMCQTTNPTHAYRDVFYRRLKQGRWHRVPALGLKEFVPDYIGEFRQETTVCDDINLTIPSMTYKTFSDGVNTNFKPVFLNNVQITKGRLVYVK
jgi:CRISPR-associated protein Cas5d